MISPYILTTATSQLQPQLKSGPAAPVPTDMGVEPKDQKQGEKMPLYEDSVVLPD